MAKGKQIPLWLDQEEADLLEAEVERSGQNRNSLIRRAIREMLIRATKRYW